MNVVRHIVINAKEQCSGCSACANICPKQCIRMKPDEEGFVYPVVDNSTCIECGLCAKICPIQNKVEKKEYLPQSYVVQNKDCQARKESSSGGMFSVLAEYVLAKQGIVYGAAFDENYVVKHVGIQSIDELYKLRGSKYVQSDIGETFSLAKKELDRNRLVCFSGTPCQIAGLKSFLKKDYENLLLVDIVCHGVPSPMLFKKYIDYHTAKDGALESVFFRNKEFGYAGSTMALMFKSGKKRFSSQDVHFFKETFFKNLSTRPSCYQCSFKTVNRISDFTIFDCWNVNAFNKEMDDDKGTTAVLIHSNKGIKIFNEVSEKIDKLQVDFDALKAYNGSMIDHCIPKNPRRDEFFYDVQQFTIPELIKKYTPVTMKKRCVQKVKPVLRKLGILHKLKRKIGKFL